MNKIINSLMMTEWSKDKPLYKYLKKEYVDRLFSDGELRIGTLYEFRNQELDQFRGDKDEGKKEIYDHVKDITITDPSKNNPLNSFVQQYINIEDSAKNFRISNCTFSQSLNSPNFYIYCMSKCFDTHLFDKFETDVCVKIKSPYKFIKCISKNFRNIASFVSLSPVMYGSRNQPYDRHDKYHASIIKTVEYKKQKEVRAIWVPINESEVNSMIIKIPLKCIKRFCEILPSDI